MNRSHIIGTDLAGLGFARSAAYAEQYRGQKIGCIQVLMDRGVFTKKVAEAPSVGVSVERLTCFDRIRDPSLRQYSGWQRMNAFERQRAFRDFKIYGSLRRADRRCAGPSI